MSGWPPRGGWRENPGAGWSRFGRDRHGPRDRGGPRRHRDRLREGSRPRLGLSPSTVKHHLANARSKVGAETTAQLVWILARRLPEPLEPRLADERSARGQTVANPDPPEDQNSAPSTSVTTR
jgi:hypothetical protein